MKKFFYFAVTVGMLSSCNSSPGPENSAESIDRVVTTDTVLEEQPKVVPSVNTVSEPVQEQATQTEDVQQVHNAAAEQAEAKTDDAFSRAIPDIKKIYNLERDVNAGKYLKSLGYTGSKKEVPTIDGPKMVQDYSFSAGDKTINVHLEQLMGSQYLDVNINGDDKALEEFYKKAKKLQGRGDYWYCNVTKKGNKISVSGGMD